MFISESYAVNEKGNLTIGGVDTTELAARFGTPLYVMDENLIRENCRAFMRAFDEFYGGKGLPIYASKAFACKEIYRIINEEGFGTDVVSGGELYTAMSVDFPAKKIYFHGNNKTSDELEMALDYGVHRIVVDNLTELETLADLAAAKGKTANVMFRIKPGVEAHTHSFIKTGQIDSKFGLALETGEAMAAVKAALQYDSVSLCGLHCHIGSQIFDIDPFEHAAEVMMRFFKDVKEQTGFVLQELNLGGGFGIKYLPNQNHESYWEFTRRVSNAVKAGAQACGIPVPFMTIEPGRSIVGAAGLTLYRVGAVKNIPNVRSYVSVDGGMGDNPRYILYQSEYDVCVANKAGEPKDFVATIAGRCCESGDLIQENAPIQTPEPGDILAVFATGAYNYSMASNYNRIPRPAVVFVKDGEARGVIRRESYEDIIRNDI